MDKKSLSRRGPAPGEEAPGYHGLGAQGPSARVVEEEVALDTLPAAARAAIVKAAGSGKVGMVEKATKGAEVTYEAHVRAGGKKSEVLVRS